MPRISALSKDQMDDKAAELLAPVEAKLGRIPNIYATFAHSPAALEAILGFGGAMAKSSLSPALREKIALTVAGLNNCKYCASAHSAIASNLGVNEEEITSGLKGASSQPEDQAALKFVVDIVETRGFVSDESLAAIKEAGYSEAQVIEVVAVVVQNIFTNFFNHVVDTEIDFPVREI